MSLLTTVWHKLQGWKTLAFNALAAVVPIMELTQWHSIIPSQYLPYYGLAVAVANLLLRHMTKTPVGYKKDA